MRTARPDAVIDERGQPRFSSDFSDKASERNLSQIGEFVVNLRKWIGGAEPLFNRGQQASTQVRVGNARMFDQCADGSVGCQLLSTLRKGGFVARLLSSSA